LLTFAFRFSDMESLLQNFGLAMTNLKTKNFGIGDAEI
jgi:hypothetical protein